jgi:putative DNA primase/helicase
MGAPNEPRDQHGARRGHDMSALPEVPHAIAEEIASWRRVMGQAPPANTRKILKLAARALWAALKVNKTEHPETATFAQQEVVDALHDLAVTANVDPDDAQLIFSQAKDEPAPAVHADHEIGAGAGDVGDGGASLPTIKVVPGELPRVVDEAEAALISNGSDIYRRGGQLIRPVVDDIPGADKSRVRSWRLVPITRAHLVERLTTIARFQKFDRRAKGYVTINCSDQVAETYLAREGCWQVPPLIGVINAPMLRGDGSLLDQPGYDAATGLLFEPEGIVFQDVPARPTKEDAERALDVLEDLISTFPFVDGVDRSVAISAILSALDRRAVPTVPLHAFSAPVAGSGKTMLVDICSIIATGRAAPVIDQSKDDVETDKRLVAALLRGSSIISIDNCERPIDSSLLCQALTAVGVMQIRALGASRDIDVPNTAMFYATGNNLTLTGDLVRRVVVCRLDPQCERPETRTFERDPRALAQANRAAYVAAGLTILRAHLCDNRPVSVTPIGSYVEWSRRVREALVWMGRPDPGETMMSARAEDPVTSMLAAMLGAWIEVIGEDKPITVQALVEMADRVDLGGAAAYPNLREVMLAVAADGKAINVRRLGKWLGKMESRVVDRHRIVKAGTSHKVALWAVQAVVRGV